MAKDRLAGDFVRLSHDWRMREEAIKRQQARDLSKIPKIKILVQGRITKTVCYLNEVWQYLIGQKIDITEQIEEFSSRQDPSKKEPWILRKGKRFINQ